MSKSAPKTSSSRDKKSTGRVRVYVVGREFPYVFRGVDKCLEKVRDDLRDGQAGDVVTIQIGRMDKPKSR